MGTIIEKWKNIIGYENYYQISNLGNIKSLDRKIWNGKGYYTKQGSIINSCVNKKGYEMVYLSKNNKDKMWFVHRLVGIHFIPNPNKLPQINHIDGNKKNNNLKNLEWCNNKHNQLHAFNLGLNKHSERAGRKKIKIIQKDKDSLQIIGRYLSIAEATKCTGKSCCCIRKGIYKQTKNGISGGFIWEIDN